MYLPSPRRRVVTWTRGPACRCEHAGSAGGQLHRDRAGQLTGLLIETAWSHAHAASLAGIDERERYADLIEERARVLLSYGITAVHDTAMSPRVESAYRLLASQGRLPISVLGFPHAAELLTGPDPARRDGPVTGEGDEHFRIGPVKIFADGVWPPACDGHIDGERVTFGETLPGLDDNIRVESLAASALPSTPSATSASQPPWRVGVPPRPISNPTTACASSTSCSRLERSRRDAPTWSDRRDPTRVRHGNGRPGPQPRVRRVHLAAVRGPRESWHPARRII